MSKIVRTESPVRFENAGVTIIRMVAPVEAVVEIPETLNDTDAAPLLCAGVTTFDALRHTGALPGDLVAVEGIGGLGHLGIQFANKSGYKVAAIGRGSESAALAKELGASVYIDNQSTNASQAVQKLGDAPGHSGYGPKLKSHVRTDRRSSAKRQAHSYRRCSRSHRGRAASAHCWN